LDGVVDKNEYVSAGDTTVVGHWFCHKCKAHFGMPCISKDDPYMIYLCPSCKSIEIEREKE